MRPRSAAPLGLRTPPGPLSAAAASSTAAFAAAGYHPRIEAGLTAVEGETLGPITLALTPLAADEQPHIELVGIGTVLSSDGDNLRVQQVYPGSGAEAAGILPGDAVTAVDGIPITAIGFDGAMSSGRMRAAAARPGDERLSNRPAHPPLVTRSWRDQHAYVRANDAVFIGQSIEHETGNDKHGNREFDGWYTMSWTRDLTGWKVAHWTWQPQRTELEQTRDAFNEVRAAILDEDATISMMSRYKVDGGVGVYVAVRLNASGQSRGQPQRLLETFPGFVLHVFSRPDSPSGSRCGRACHRRTAWSTTRRSGTAASPWCDRRCGRCCSRSRRCR